MSVTLANSTVGGTKDRPDTDFYPTPAPVTHALLDWLQIPTGSTIWECACGEGHMSEVMQKRGYNVECSDLYKSGVDFRTAGLLDVDWIITNPPFNVAEEFIRHAHDLQPGGFAFLLKSQYWHSAKRNSLFHDIRPFAVLPLSWRPDFLFGKKSGAPTMEVLWTVWKAPYTNSTTFYQPLARPKV
jgi:hypothetical protein